MSGSFESVRWNACVHRLDLSFTLIQKSFRGMELEPMLTPRGKSPLLEKLSPEEDRTNDAVQSRTVSPTHYQQAIPAPDEYMYYELILIIACPIHIQGRAKF